MKIVPTASSAALLGAVCLALTLSLALADADIKAPVVNIYTQTPLEYGQKNTLICHTSGFHPPLIHMELRRNSVPLRDCTDSDLSFDRDWAYRMTKHVAVTPEKGDTWECVVQHNNGNAQIYRLEIF